MLENRGKLRRRLVPLRSERPLEAGQTIFADGELEIREVRKAVRSAGTNKSRASEMLGLSRFALQRKLEKYELGEDRPGAGEDQGA